MTNTDKNTYAVYLKILNHLKSGEISLTILSRRMDTEINVVRHRMNCLMNLGFVKGELKEQPHYKHETWHYTALRSTYPISEYETFLANKKAKRAKKGTRQETEELPVAALVIKQERNNAPDRIIVQGNVTTYNLSHHDNYSHRRAPVKPTIMGSSMSMF